MVVPGPASVARTKSTCCLDASFVASVVAAGSVASSVASAARSAVAVDNVRLCRFHDWSLKNKINDIYCMFFISISP